MKITNFQVTIQQNVDEQGYGENFYIYIDDKGLANVSRPYKAIPVEEQLAIEEVIASAIKAHLKLVKQVDNANKDLKLEQYAPIELSEEPDTEPTLNPDANIFGAPEVPTESTSTQSSDSSVGTTQTEQEESSIKEVVEIKDALFENPEQPFGLNKEQIKVLKDALMSDEPLKGKEDKELEVIVGE